MKFKCIKTPEEFKKSREEVLTKFQDFYDTYSEFTKSTRPPDWRLTGNHFAELRKIKEDIPCMDDPLTMKDLENDLIRDQVLTDEEQELWNNAKKYNL